MIVRVVSGGQTGVDRAALDVALALGIPCGGWCPRGRRAEDGRIPARYPLLETPSPAYPVRTRWNVRDSDGTLILRTGPSDRGTALTIRLAADLARPLLDLDLASIGAADALAHARAWLAENEVRVLNVAGPRESRCPGAHAAASRFLVSLLTR